MGFLKVINADEFNMSKMLSYWSDAVFMEKSPRVCMDLSLLENGKKVLVAPLQMLVQIKEKKVIDVITEAGGYIYHSDLEKNKDVEQYAEVLDEYFEKDDAVSQHTEIVCINLYSDNNILNQLKEYITSNAASKGYKEESGLSKPMGEQPKMNINFCRECGNKLPMPGIKFCPNCGTKL